MANPIAVPGTNVPSGAAVSPGGAQGAAGPLGPAGPNAVSADAGNLATLGTDNLISVPSSGIWSVRLRSVNSVGNPNFEAAQRNIGNLLTNPATGTFIEDKWIQYKAGTATLNYQAVGSSNSTVIPGTSFRISSKFLNVTLTGQQASLAAGDYIQINQFIEGPQLRELINDVHSISLMVSSSVPGLKFSVALRDYTTTQSLVKLCTIPAASTWTLIQLPNLPVWPSGNFSILPGNAGYQLTITLAAGATFTAPSADVWNAGNFLGAPGMSNWAASPVNSTFQVAFVQHEPGPVCSTLIDKPFSQNLDECLRFYQKTYDLDIAPGSATTVTGISFFPQASTTQLFGALRFHKPMAKIPSVIAYNHSTGAANSVRHTNGSDFAVTSIPSVGKAGFYSLVTATLPAAVVGAGAYFHYTADTGW